MREMLGYPPFCDLVQMIFQSQSEAKAAGLAEEAYDFLRNMLGEERVKCLYPPKPAALRSEGGRFRYQVLLKIPKGERPRFSACIASLKQALLKQGKIGDAKKSGAMMLTDFNPYGMI